MPPAAAAIALPYILGATAIAGTGLAVAGMSQQKKAGKQAQAAQEAQSANQARLEGEAKSRAANEESEANAIDVRNTAQQRQRARAVGAGGRQDTILTGPSGDAGVAAGGQKTLLGT